MIGLADTAPDIQVREPEYRRLLGYPRRAAARELDERVRELMAWAPAWYAAHGRPWLYAREARSLALAGDTVVLEGVPFAAARLERRLREADATGAVLVAVSAGPELEAEAQRLWQEEKPDEYFFLEVFGSAVVEHLVRVAGARLCAAAEPAGLAVLPHYSPGYPEWDVGEQGRLLQLIRRDAVLPGPLETLESGMPRPKKSLLAVFGLTPRREHTRPLAEVVACETCTLPGCQFRRAPYDDRASERPSGGAEDRATEAPRRTSPPVANAASASAFAFAFGRSSPDAHGRVVAPGAGIDRVAPAGSKCYSDAGHGGRPGRLRRAILGALARFPRTRHTPLPSLEPMG